MPSLTVVCPAYNEEEAVGPFFMRLRVALTGLGDGYAWNVLFVVDRSADATLALLREFARKDPRVQVLGLSARFGHQKSLLAGIDHCRSDIVIMMDSDGQHPPELIPEMLAAHARGAEIVHTRRSDPPSIGFLKRASSRLFYRLLNAVSEVPIHPGAADYRLLSRRVARLFQERIRERNLFLRGLFSWIGFRSATLDFETGARAGGRSKYGLGRLIRLGLEGIVAFSRRPLQAAIGMGLLFAALGLGLAAATFIQYFYYGDLPPGWTTIAILVPTFSGIQLIFLGVLGEYIGAIFDEVKQRPHYLVEESINLEP